MGEFENRNNEMIARMSRDDQFKKNSLNWLVESLKHEYSYHFTWMGMPIIQYPQDILAIQELIFSIKPDLIIETGIARGGSLVFSASMLELLGGDRMVLGIDIDIRSHNREAIEAHPMKKRITMMEGSSIDQGMADKVKAFASRYKNIMVVLDSNHTHDHVLRELELYSSLVTKGSYCVVLDTAIEDIPKDPARSWGKGNSPKSAVWKFLETNKRFVIDEKIDSKLMISVGPNGYLKCVAD